MQTIWAEQALTSEGWRSNVSVTINSAGVIEKVETDTTTQGPNVGILLPSPANLHSHSFQRAMAGLTEARSNHSHDSFWSWRDLMYRFVAQLTPDDVQSIAAFVQMEMLEAGYAAIAEFHYLHHETNGTNYSDIGEMSARIAAAADETGIGLTLLPVLYQQSSCNGQALNDKQLRFGNDIDQYARLLESASKSIKKLPADAVIGIAPHSLRAVNQASLSQAITLVKDSPIHIHIAEQTVEIEEVKAYYGYKPIEWLLNNYDVNHHWCLIHATHMSPKENEAVAKSGSVIGLCPITEANLGDGIFEAAYYLENGGRFGIGSDSNIRISLSEELRLLEYTQRLRDHQRAVLATQKQSTGRLLYEQIAIGGAQAAGRNSGIIKEGYTADLVALNSGATELINKNGDIILDTYIFAGDDWLVQDVWSAGRHLVSQGQHKNRHAITTRFRETILSLSRRL